ncbi:MAG: pseudaminic acid synthase [Chloroflexi bacterium]|nr:pseudaminic acid synthase [Chloroflexota bacterium]
MQGIAIENKIVGIGEPCFIIAEAGSNHDGNINQAKELIDIAANSGADAVKFQLFRADEMAAKTSDPIANIDISGCKTLHELYKSMEIPAQWVEDLFNHATRKGILFLCTPFHEQAVDHLDDMGIGAFKVASFELVHLPLIRHIARKGKPVILSTGMANLSEIEDAIAAIVGEGNVQIILLHCGSGYPHNIQDVHLAAIDTIRQAFGYPVGYSDHTLGITVPIAAVARGANVIEKHFTIRRDLPGPDHFFALEPAELKAMVTAIRDTEKAIGRPYKMVTESEKLRHKRGRRSIFARVDIPKGTCITAEMLAILRPGIGLMPKHLDLIVGRSAQVDIKSGEPITWDGI